MEDLQGASGEGGWDDDGWESDGKDEVGNVEQIEDAIHAIHLDNEDSQKWRACYYYFLCFKGPNYQIGRKKIAATDETG